jgi:pyrophosphatase PpaX
MKPLGLRAVLFDWDGTLVDSAEGSYRCYVHTFGSLGYAFDRARYAETYSPDWYRTYEGIGLPRELWAQADARWQEHYRSNPNPLLPGTLAALQLLRGRGLALGIVSSGEKSRVSGELASLEVAPLLAVVVCANDVQCRKPHPEGLLTALRSLGVDAGEAAYVGDSPEDVEMARTAGVYAIGVPGGFPNREALEASRPDHLAADLTAAIAHLLA